MPLSRERRRLLPLEAAESLDMLAGKVRAEQDGNNSQTALLVKDIRDLYSIYSLGRVPTVGDKPGMYRWMDAAGQVIDIAWNGKAETGRTPALAPATAESARRNILIEELSERSREDGPQFVDGNRWTWAATGEKDGGTVVTAANGGYWQREFVGPLDVRWFGAVGDGITDDSDAITRAVNALNNRVMVRSRATLHFPTGTYSVTRGWLLENNVSITGEGRNSLFRIRSNLPAREEITGTAIFMGKAAWRNIDTGICRGIHIRSIAIELEIPAARTDDAFNVSAMLGGIKLVNPHECSVIQCYFKNTPSFAIQLRSTSLPSLKDGSDVILGPVDPEWGVRNNVVTQNYIDNPTDWYLPGGRINYTTCIGLSVTGTIGPRLNGGKDSLRSHIEPSPNYIAPNCVGNSFNYNTFIGGSHGAYVTAASENDISGNLSRHNSHRGIAFAYNCCSNLISRNRIFDVGSAGIHYAYDCYNNVISGNTIDRVGLHPGISGGEYYGIKGYVGVYYNVITANTISNCKNATISISHGACFNIISENNLTLGLVTTQTNTIGIEINATRIPQYDEGLVFGDSTEVRGNSVTGNIVDGFDYGIVLTDAKSRAYSVSYNKVTANSIFNCRIHGISNNGRVAPIICYNTISNNILSGNGFPIVTDFRVGGNVVFGNQGDSTVRQLFAEMPNSAHVAAGDTPTKQEFDALLNEVRYMKTLLGNQA